MTGPNFRMRAGWSVDKFAQEKSAEPVIMLSSMRRTGEIIGKIKWLGCNELERMGLDRFGRRRPSS